MISHKYKCIFIHIPKCAGTSIEVVLGHFEDHEGRGGQDHRTIRMIEKPIVTPHLFSEKENIKEVLRGLYKKFEKKTNPRNKTTVTTKQYNDYFKFSFVRNPWTRAFSWYKNVMRDEVHQKNLGVEAEISFKDFLKTHAGKGMLMPQTYWLKNFKGEVDLDFIGRFENLEEDFNIVAEKLGVSKLTLPHKIKGTTEDFSKFYDNESIKIISEVFAEEIELFDYSFPAKT